MTGHAPEPAREVQHETTEAAPAAPTARRRVGSGLRLALAVAALVHPACRLLASRFWLADLFSHFREVAAAVTLALAATFVRSRPRVALAVGGLGLLQLAPLAAFYRASPIVADPSRPDRLRVAAANVLVSNRRPEPLIAWVERERPDVLGLVEVSGRWLDDLEPIRRTYPHRIELPAGANGLALWSRLPFRRRDEPAVPTPDGWPYLHASVDFAGREVHLWLVHPMSPTRRRGLHEDNPELVALAAAVASEPGSHLLFGDMNTTDGSPHFGAFLAASGLRDSRVGFGRQPTWPSWLPYRIAIDHILVSPDLAVVNRRVGPPVGSDHLPLATDLAPASSR